MRTVAQRAHVRNRFRPKFTLINARCRTSVEQIEHCGRQLAFILDIVADLLHGLNENLAPTMVTVDTARVADLKVELLGALTDARSKAIAGLNTNDLRSRPA
jgi:hypothetical protein